MLASIRINGGLSTASDDAKLDNPDSKIYGTNMGPIWGRQDPGGPHVGPMNFPVWEILSVVHLLQARVETTSMTKESTRLHGKNKTWFAKSP